MSHEEVDSILKTADIHKLRLNQALRAVQQLFPMTAETVINLNEQQLFAIETLTNRFAKLQDLMGSKLFDLCLLSLGETIEGLSMIDKANKLEKASVLDSTPAWMNLRKLRNGLAHEYPDHPEIAASILNSLHAQIQPVFTLCDRLQSIIRKSS